MTTLATTTTLDQVKTDDTHAHDHPIHNPASKTGSFIRHFLEMLLAMMAGMAIFHLLENLIPASSSYAVAFESDTNLYDLAMAVFMTVPMVAWMRVRGHGWRHSAEMAFGMNAPVAAIIVLRLLGADAYLPWLDKASHPAMFLGMLAAMLYRRDHYMGKAGHAAHAAHLEANNHAIPVEA